MPFNNEVECTGCLEELIPHIEVSLIHQGMEVKPDPDGEERILQVDAVLELNMRMYKEEEHELLLDAYSPVRSVFCIEKMRCWRVFWYAIFPNAG